MPIPIPLPTIGPPLAGAPGGPPLPLEDDELAETGDSLEAMQEADGAIPWHVGGHTDAWNHLECVMALQVTGHWEAAERGWHWLYRTQRADGSWVMSRVAGEVTDASADTNQCAYVATAAWHRWLSTGDRAFVARVWPVVRRALSFVVDLQEPSGAIRWARWPDGTPHEGALLTGCSSTLSSLCHGLGLAALVGEEQPEWELAAGALRHALRDHPEAFMPKDRWSMDWYYPVIGGALRGAEGRARLRSQMSKFMVEPLGVRCVSDEPWVTGAETCELAIAMHLVGETAAAAKLVADMQHLRHDDGSYWTGWQFVDRRHYPDERSSWTAAAVVLAVDALRGGVTDRTFRGDDLPAGFDVGGPTGAPRRVLTPAGAAGGAPAAPVTGGCGCPID
jgi:hypothetical protein